MQISCIGGFANGKAVTVKLDKFGDIGDKQKYHAYIHKKDNDTYLDTYEFDKKCQAYVFYKSSNVSEKQRQEPRMYPVRGGICE